MTNRGSVVICKLPKAGLGNQLFPLMRAYTFAHLNQLPVFVINYHQLKIGPWLRGERTKRNYNGFFAFQKNIIAGQLDKLKIKRYKFDSAEIELEIKQIKKEDALSHSYFFSAIPHYGNYFEGLKENRLLMIELFWKLIRPEVIEKVNALKAPYIGVHIRMGDYRKLKPGEEFGKFGSVRTPENYFMNVIENLRKTYGSELPVSVFTDGHMEEFEQLFSLENIEMIQGNNDLVDMLLLSKSKIIVTSAGSTFSYWSAFISDAPVIMHPSYIFQSLRPIEVNRVSYEGPFDENNEQFTKQIRAIQYD